MKNENKKCELTLKFKLRRVKATKTKPGGFLTIFIRKIFHCGLKGKSCTNVIK